MSPYEMIELGVETTKSCVLLKAFFLRFFFILPDLLKRERMRSMYFLFHQRSGYL